MNQTTYAIGIATTLLGVTDSAATTWDDFVAELRSTRAIPDSDAGERIARTAFERGLAQWSRTLSDDGWLAELARIAELADRCDATKTAPTDPVLPLALSYTKLASISAAHRPEGWTGTVAQLRDRVRELRAALDGARYAIRAANEAAAAQGVAAPSASDLVRCYRMQERARGLSASVRKRIYAALDRQDRKHPSQGGNVTCVATASAAPMATTAEIRGEQYSSRSTWAKISYAWTIRASVREIETALSTHETAVVVRRERGQTVAYIPEFGRGFELRLRREVVAATAAA